MPEPAAILDRPKVLEAGSRTDDLADLPHPVERNERSRGEMTTATVAPETGCVLRRKRDGGSEALTRKARTPHRPFHAHAETRHF